jgi:recombination protein RecT
MTTAANTDITKPEEHKAIVIKASAPAGNQQTLKAFLDGAAVKKQLAEALGKSGITADDMNRLALVCTTKQPMILKCTLASIFRSLLDAAALGITVGGLNGRGYLVPRTVKIKDKDASGRETERKEYQCFLDPGYRGFMDIARDGGVGLIQAEVVYEKDEFEYWFAPLPSIRFKPMLTGDRGAVVAAFAIAQVPGGALQIEVVTRGDLDKIMKVSESGKNGNGPWDTWYAEMARKSALRRLCKFLPVKGRENQARVDRAMMLSDRADTGDPSIGDEAFDMQTGEIIDVAGEVKGALAAKGARVDTNELESELAEVLK